MMPPTYDNKRIETLNALMTQFFKDHFILTVIGAVSTSILYALGFFPAPFEQYFEYLYESTKAKLTRENVVNFIKALPGVLLYKVLFGMFVGSCTFLGSIVITGMLQSFYKDCENIITASTVKRPHDYVLVYAPILEEIEYRVNFRLILQMIGLLFLGFKEFVSTIIFPATQDEPEDTMEPDVQSNAYALSDDDQQFLNNFSNFGSSAMFSQAHGVPIRREIFIFGWLWCELASQEGILASTAAHITNNVLATSGTMVDTMVSMRNAVFNRLTPLGGR